MVSKIWVLSSWASGLSYGWRMRMKASARPCTPIPIGLCRRFDLLACTSTKMGLVKQTTMLHVCDTEATPEKRANLGHRVVINVNDLVQVLDDGFSDRCQLIEVVGPLGGDVHVQSNGSQVTHRNLIRRNNRSNENLRCSILTDHSQLRGITQSPHLCSCILLSLCTGCCIWWCPGSAGCSSRCRRPCRACMACLFLFEIRWWRTTAAGPSPRV